MITISTFIKGTFAEDKDVALKIRKDNIIPILSSGAIVEIDFSGIEDATQSFVHALLSDVVRKMGEDILDRITFKNCNDRVRTIIEIVVEYSQDTLE